MLPPEYRRFVVCDVYGSGAESAKPDVIQRYEPKRLNTGSDLTANNRALAAARVFHEEMYRLKDWTFVKTWSAQSGLVDIQNFLKHISFYPFT